MYPSIQLLPRVICTVCNKNLCISQAQCPQCGTPRGDCSEEIVQSPPEVIISTGDPWECVACTFINAPQDAHCKVCEAPRGPTTAGKRNSFADSGIPELLEEDTRKEQIRIRDMKENEVRLKARLEEATLVEHACKDDGSCMFRAVSRQLWLDERYYSLVRTHVVEYLQATPKDYEFYFETPDEFARYCEQLSNPKVWGDEITLKALAEAFRINIHVITSALERWFLTYTPTSVRSPEIHVFLTYYAPVHYNCLEIPPQGRRSSGSSFPSEPDSPMVIAQPTKQRSPTLPNAPAAPVPPSTTASHNKQVPSRPQTPRLPTSYWMGTESRKAPTLSDPATRATFSSTTSAGGRTQPVNPGTLTRVSTQVASRGPTTPSEGASMVESTLTSVHQSESDGLVPPMTTGVETAPLPLLTIPLTAPDLGSLGKNPLLVIFKKSNPTYFITTREGKVGATKDRRGAALFYMHPNVKDGGCVAFQCAKTGYFLSQPKVSQRFTHKYLIDVYSVTMVPNHGGKMGQFAMKWDISTGFIKFTQPQLFLLLLPDERLVLATKSEFDASSFLLEAVGEISGVDSKRLCTLCGVLFSEGISGGCQKSKSGHKHVLGCSWV